MENSELQTQIINLGKLLVTELGSEPGGDTLSRWMAHYVAEKMIQSDNSLEGKDRKDAEKECSETILKLWEHRWLLSPGKRPLEKFEAILKTLERLNPEQQEPFFYRSLDYELSELEKDNPDIEEITDYTNMALEIDKVARIWIEFVLHQGALKAKNEKTAAFLKNAVNLRDNDDITTVRLIFDNDLSIDSGNYNEDNFQRNYRLEKLKRRVEELERFSKLNDFLLKGYRKELGASK